jgi:hypothetical protein
MKKSIILIILMSTLLSHSTIEAESSCKKNVCKPKKMKHKNRKVGSCNKNDSCGKKNVRLDRFVPWNCNTDCN